MQQSSMRLTVFAVATPMYIRRWTVGGHTTAISPGQVWFMKPNLRHGPHSFSTCVLSYMHVMMDGDA